MEDLEDILEGDRKNRFKVDTKEDGIRNTSYSIDKYTSNKIMWLVQEKIRQIVNVFNKYIIALSVKMECICNYVQQSSDIINSFTYMDKASTCSTKSDDGDLNNDGEISQEEEDESKEDNALDGGDDILTDEDETENDVEVSDEESDDTEGSEIEEVSDDEPEADFEVGEDEGEDLKEASMDILTSIHEYNMHVMNYLFLNMPHLFLWRMTLLRLKIRSLELKRLSEKQLNRNNLSGKYP